MSFKDIKGQDKALDILKDGYLSGRLSHAYIFWGPEGVGKRTMALNFAKLLNCLDPRKNEPCEECASCRKISTSNHPDVYLFSPEKDDSPIGIDKMRLLIKDISLKPYEAKKKVYIIDGAHGMTREASNAVLKTLEEPPSDSALVLITRSLTELLPTIVSRAQAVKFYSLGIEEAERVLVDMHKTQTAEAHILARLASGRIGQALRYRDSGFLEKRAGVVAKLAENTFFDSDFDGLTRAELRVYLDIALGWYRDIMITKAAGIDALQGLVNIDKKDMIMKEASRLGMERIDEIIRRIILTGYFLETNANPKLVLASLGVAAYERI